MRVTGWSSQSGALTKHKRPFECAVGEVDGNAASVDAVLLEGDRGWPAVRGRSLCALTRRPSVDLPKAFVIRWK